jgi:hypothetical protein
VAAGHVNRTSLEANYQSPGQFYDDTKTEGAFEVVAQQVDDNYDADQTHKLAAILDHPDGSVTNAKIADGALTAAKFVAGVLTNETANGLRITAHEAENAIDAHSVMPAVKVTHNVSQSIADATATPLAFNTERFDTNAIHDPVTNNSRLTCKTAGKYIITGQVAWSSNTGSTHQALIKLNNTTFLAYIESTPLYSRMEVSTLYELAVNDYVELIVLQSSGGSKTITAPEFSMVKVG